MLAFSIDEENTRVFMQKLLKENTFDNLEVRNFLLETIVKYDISGNINKEYLAEGENRFFIKWLELKPYILNIIKGSIKPKSIKMVFSLSDKEVLSLCENANAMFLNLTYNRDNNCIIGTTGTSQKSFCLDKKEDNIWEDKVINFLKENNINIKTI